MFPGPGRLDGGVERQEIRLAGDAGNGIHNGADLLRPGTQFVDEFRRHLRRLFDVFDLPDGGIDFFTAAGRLSRCFLRIFRRLRRLLLHLIHGSRDLGNMLIGIVDIALLLQNGIR